MNGGLLAVAIDAVANALAGIAKGARLFGGVRRLMRLAALRAHVRGSIPYTTQFDGTVFALGTGNIVLGANCRLGHGVQLETARLGEIRVGARVRINAGSLLAANYGILIGDDTLIGEYVSIRDSNHGTTQGQLIRLQPAAGRRIDIGSDVWIGRGCCILSGVSIGDGAVVGANSVVTKDIPANAIWVGTAASEIGTRRP